MMRRLGSRVGRSISSKMIRLGLIINPIAGMGGLVALKGTDGSEILQQAIERGATKSSLNKAIRAFERISSENDWMVYTAQGEMGEDLCLRLGIPYQVVYRSKQMTTSEDTIAACQKLIAHQVDCLVFAGGDGTARDVLDGTKSAVPALGIPAGVKIQSSVFAVSPEAAGDILTQVVDGKVVYHDKEVIDLDEAAYRNNQLKSSLYGYLKVPTIKRLMQNKKAPSPVSEGANRIGIAWSIIEQMEPEVTYFIGAGTTTKAILEVLDLNSPLLGIDAIRNKKLIQTDLDASAIEKLIEHNSVIIVSPIGGQGFIFGRGNQQFTPEILKAIGKDNIQIVATQQKIIELYGDPLLIDTGDPDTDQMLSGYYRVQMGHQRQLMYPVKKL